MAAKNDAEKQGMVTNVTYVQNQNPDTVLSNIRVLVDTHSKAGVRLCCGIAQFLIVRAYHQNDQERWSIDRSRDYLKTQLNDCGLKTAMAYRYIQTGHKLAQMFVKKYALGGIVGDVLKADNENKAFSIIERATIGLLFMPDPAKPLKAWATDAEHKPRLSMDVLAVNLGLVALPITATVDAANPAAALGAGTAAPTPTVPATKAKPASIIARLVADKDLVKSLPDNIVMAKADVIGREVMAERLVSLMTIEECTKLQSALVARMTVLANAPKVETPPADIPTPPAETPQEGEAVPGEQVQSRRSRSRSRRAA